MASAEGATTAPEVARRAGLRYVDGDSDGIRRRRCGRGFTYVDAEGETVRDEEVRRRAEELAIPPAWEDVWIAADPDAHVQATGRDAEGRKQYIYHPRWKAARELDKFRRIRELGAVLPPLRRRVGRIVGVEGLGRARVVAGAVRLLDRSSMRVGNEEYVDDHGSFGLTTLRRRHVRIRDDGRACFRYPGKSGQERRLEVRDRRLADFLREVRRLEGDRLFSFRRRGEIRSLTADDLNAWLRETTERDVSAKDFRTWAGTLWVLRSLRDAETPSSEDEARERTLEALDRAAELLGNSRATTREFYVHPGLVGAWERGELADLIDDVRSEADDATALGHRTCEPLLLVLLPRLERFLDGA